MIYYNSDASTIGYTSGYTGAVPRSVLSRLQDWISVVDLGADPTGTNDSAPAISAAISAAGSRQLWFPNGTYKLNSNVTPSSVNNFMFDSAVTFTGTGTIAIGNSNNSYTERNYGATAGSVMRVQKQWSQGSDVANLAYLWTNSTAAYFGIGKQFNSGYTGSPAGSPYSALAAWATDNASGADVVSMLGVVQVLQNNGIGFGANFISTNASGNTNTKLVGVEIDIEPTSGTTVNGGSAGLYVNAFNVGSIGPVMQVGGVSGGTFSNGILLNAIASGGSAIAAQSGLSCTNFINTVSGGFSGAAIQMGNGQGIGWSGGGSINGDSGGNVNCTPSGAFITQGNNTTEGNTLALFRDSSATASLQVFVARGSAANSANAAIKVNGQSATSRSINAGGTINASGADYAEYETKRGDCGTIAKGQIIGFDSSGLVTDKFSLSISFGIKSTNPNIVGGDDWHVGPAPVEPVAPVQPEPLTHGIVTSRALKYAAQIAQEQADIDAKNTAAEQAYHVELARYQAEYAIYQPALAAWDSAMEEARQKVDRIAYCGKVPVNVTGAKPGQYLVPFAGADDSIAGMLVDKAAISPCQYMNAIGQVRRILPDGRAEVTVKPI